MKKSVYRESDRAKSVIWANYRYPGQLQICNPGKSQICTAPLRESSPSNFSAAQVRENLRARKFKEIRYVD